MSVSVRVGMRVCVCECVYESVCVRASEMNVSGNLGMSGRMGNQGMHMRSHNDTPA